VCCLINRLAVFHLRNADVMATYRVNGTSWAFDATKLLGLH